MTVSTMGYMGKKQEAKPSTSAFDALSGNNVVSTITTANQVAPHHFKRECSTTEESANSATDIIQQATNKVTLQEQTTSFERFFKEKARPVE